MITTIYLIHHSHTDLGYTDLPSTTWRLHADYIRQAMDLIDATARLPDPARFRWTCEVALTTRHFLERATPAERRRFTRHARTGRMEVCGMPFNVQPHYSAPQWQALLDTLAPFYRQFRPVVAMQNDINGFQWGMLPALRRRGIKYVWMGMNAYSGGSPLKPPAAFWWEGSDGRKTLTFINRHYCDGYSLFFPGEWRVGPVPSSTDPWFHPPVGRQTFDDSPASLHAAHSHLTERLATTFADYPYAVLPGQVTNMYRMDNDPPCGQLAHFVRAWNAAGLQPALQLATPRMFMDYLARQRGIPTLRGDWPDWWADGAASIPLEVALNQRTKQILTDLPTAAKTLRTKAPDLAAAWTTASIFDEHTFGAFEAIAAPYAPRAIGSHTQKTELAYRAHEDTHALQRAVITASRVYRPSADTRTFAVLNPGTTPRSGWANIPAAALRGKATAARDLATGTLYPLETILAQTWMGASDRPDLPYENPQDTGAFIAETLRFHLAEFAPGELRRFEFVDTEVAAPSMPAAAGSTEDFRWQWNEPTGALLSLLDIRTRTELLDPPPGRSHAPAAPHFALGDVIIEHPLGFGARDRLYKHDYPADAADVLRRTAVVTAWRPVASHYGPRYLLDLDDPACHHLRQRWDFLPGRRIEITTTLWLRECTAPQAIYLAFPFGLKQSTAAYDSLGHRTRVGLDQIPGSCAEYFAVNAGVEFSTPRLTLALATPDTPLGTFDALATRTGRTAFVPANAHFFSFLSHNYWATNFSITRPGKLIVRHIITLDTPHAHPLDRSATDLWTFPAAT